MKEIDRLSGIKVCVKGGGDIASGVAWRLHQCGFKVFITEIDQPVAVRRKVAFCEAVYEGKAVVQGVEALLIHDVNNVCPTWDQGKIPILIDTHCRARYIIKPEVIVDAIMAKKNIGSSINDAPLVIALGPGFEAGRDAHLVVESHRRHNLGRLLAVGSAQPDTGVPGPVLGITTDRVLRAPADGLWQSAMKIGDLVEKGDSVGSVAGVPVKALIEGVLRGMIRPGINVQEGLKIGDVDPRARREYCDTISDKALAIGGGVLEGILRFYGG